MLNSSFKGIILAYHLFKSSVRVLFSCQKGAQVYFPAFIKVFIKADPQKQQNKD